MADHPHPTGKVPQAWLDAMAKAEADIQAGRMVDSATVMRRLDQSIAGMQAQIASAACRSTAPPPPPDRAASGALPENRTAGGIAQPARNTASGRAAHRDRAVRRSTRSPPLSRNRPAWLGMDRRRPLLGCLQHHQPAGNPGRVLRDCRHTGSPIADRDHVPLRAEAAALVAFGTSWRLASRIVPVVTRSDELLLPWSSSPPSGATATNRSPDPSPAPY